MATDSDSAKRRGRAATVSVLVAVGLAVLKAAAGLLTNSLSLLASAVDSLTDIFASTVNFFAIRAASRPADHEHAYGHGKAEALAGLFQGVVIGGSALFLAYESVVRLARPVALQSEVVGIAVMGISIAASYLLVRYLRRVARATNSLALAADSLHFATDVLSNGGVLAVLFLVRVTNLPILDPIVSLAISIYIGYAAANVMRDAIDHLMDRSLPDEVHDQVREIVLAHPEIVGVHDIKTRSSGSRCFIEMHLEIDGTRSLEEAHRAAVEVLRKVERAIPDSKVFVHMDPVTGVRGQGSRVREEGSEVPTLTPDP